MNRWNWIGKSIAMVVGAVTLAGPQLAEARDRCGDNRYNSHGYYDQGRRADYRNDRYYNNNGYNNDRYSNRSYPYSDSYTGSGYGYGDYRQDRPAGQSAAIIGGGAAAGAVVGGIAGGRKGALIGAGIGAAGGLIYDRATKNNGRIW